MRTTSCASRWKTAASATCGTSAWRPWGSSRLIAPPERATASKAFSTASHSRVKDARGMGGGSLLGRGSGSCVGRRAVGIRAALSRRRLRFRVGLIRRRTHVGRGLAQKHGLAVLAGAEGDAALHTRTVVGRRGEQHVGGRVERRLAGILHHADDEADGDDLHRHLVGDAEQRAGQRDEQQ